MDFCSPYFYASEKRKDERLRWGSPEGTAKTHALMGCESPWPHNHFRTIARLLIWLLNHQWLTTVFWSLNPCAVRSFRHQSKTVSHQGALQVSTLSLLSTCIESLLLQRPKPCKAPSEVLGKPPAKALSGIRSKKITCCFLSDYF